MPLALGPAAQTKKAPGVCPGLQSMADTTRRSEAVVQTRTHEIGLEADVVGHADGGAAGDAAVELAEIDIEIFDFGAPVRHESVFETEAGGPAELSLAGIADRGRRLDVAHRRAGGDVRQPVIPAGVANAAAARGKPAIFGLAGAGGAIGAA